MESRGKIAVGHSHDGRILRVRLTAPPANVVDGETLALLHEAFAQAEDDRALRAIILDHDGPHFSYGASVEEHLPGEFEKMIPAFHHLCRHLAEAPVPVLAVADGLCLGGGMELVLLASRIFAGPKIKLGQPEIQLGVFAPVASCVLPQRIGRPAAEDLLLTGRTVRAEEARELGLVQWVGEDPGAAAVAWAEEHLLPKSAFAIRQALRAVRIGWMPSFQTHLDEVESIYLGTLMEGADPVEGLKAFLEKREPQWRDA